MRVLITGITGFVASHVFDILRNDESIEIIGMARNKEKAKKFEQQGVEIRYADLNKPETLKNITQDIDVVIHLAAKMKFHTHLKELYTPNVKATQILAEDAERNGVKHFIATSSTEAIGPVENPPADETYPCNPVFDYGKTKLMLEQALKRMYEETGFPMTIIRPTGIYGPRDQYISISIIDTILKGRLTRLPGKGDKYIHFTFVKDIAHGFVKALRNPRKAIGETFIISSDDYYTYREAFTIIANLLNAPAPTKSAPMFLAKMYIGYLEWRNNRKGIDNFVIHKKVVEEMRNHRAYSNAKAKKYLNYQPKYTLPEGMKETIAWYRENKII